MARHFCSNHSAVRSCAQVSGIHVKQVTGMLEKCADFLSVDLVQQSSCTSTLLSLSKPPAPRTLLVPLL